MQAADEPQMPAFQLFKEVHIEIAFPDLPGGLIGFPVPGLFGEDDDSVNKGSRAVDLRSAGVGQDQDLTAGTEPFQFPEKGRKQIASPILPSAR